MNIAFLMDPLHKVKPHKDTTYHLMLAAHERGHRVFYAAQDSLSLRGAELRARLTEVAVHSDHLRPFTVGESRNRALSEMQVVMVRTDPPLDRRYFYATLLLDFLPPSTRVVNAPHGLRDWNEKLAALHHPEFCPPTLIARDAGDIRAFAEAHGRAVVKPVDGHGGEGIVFVSADGGGDDLINAATAGGSRWVVAQKYLPEARAGDKRILLLNGEPLGAVLRVHAEGSELNNLDAGGVAHPATLDNRDKEICAALTNDLRKHGITFCGIDIIGGQLVEINITSPTCLQELCKFSGVDHHHRVVAALEG